ncbi:MAG: ABC transporter permease [Verrucomicrobia bacterium]|nr:ABC transporter permease [Verrucomicrobiota bacterium]
MQELVIEPGRTEKNYWGDLWRYRELFYILAWRDISVRYKQTAIGVAWAVLRPFLAMLVFTVVFGRIAKMPSNGIPYPILVFAAMLPWQFFANSLAEASQSLVLNSNLISKVYFPRLIVPAGAVITSLVDFLISAALLVLLMVWFQFMPDWRVLTLPVFTLLAFLAALGPGLLLTALTVKFRDFRYVVPFIVQFGLFISPVGFSSDVIPDQWRLVYSLNPIVGVIDGFRWAICRGAAGIYVPGFALSMTTITLFLVLGIWYFRKTEKSFADVI